MLEETQSSGSDSISCKFLGSALLCVWTLSLEGRDAFAIHIRSSQ